MPAELKPCPFCGSDDIALTDELLVCQSCGATGPDLSCVPPPMSDEEFAAAVKEAWNRRAPVPPEPVCELCSSNPAAYDAWLRKRDSDGLPGGHLVRVAICDGCLKHPFLCINESREAAQNQRGSKKAAIAKRRACTCGGLLDRDGKTTNRHDHRCPAYACKCKHDFAHDPGCPFWPNLIPKEKS